MKPHVGWSPEWIPQVKINSWAGKCPIKNLEEYLICNNIVQKKELESIEFKVDKEIDETFKSIQDEPVATMEDMLTHIYEEGRDTNE